MKASAEIAAILTFRFALRSPVTDTPKMAIAGQTVTRFLFFAITMDESFVASGFDKFDTIEYSKRSLHTRKGGKGAHV